MELLSLIHISTKIARMLTEQQTPTPGTLEYRRTGSTRRYHPGYECKWATNTVVHILENREYTGCLVNFKTEKLSYKVKHSVENPPEKQVIFENHHEPIIDTQTWAVSYTHLDVYKRQTVDRAQELGEQFCKEHFPGHQALVCTHPDGHNHSGNIHVHIVINSLRIEMCIRDSTWNWCRRWNHRRRKGSCRI